MPAVGTSRRRAGSIRPRRTYVQRNRRIWNRTSGAYDRRHARELAESGGRAWGLWRIPESRLRLLGPVRGRRTLELGCGAARWSVGLAGIGAHPVGIDLSDDQLAAARRVVGPARVALVHGSAEDLPFGSATFDLVLSDWGAMTFADPERTVPEVARVLRPGGRFVFAASSPFRYVALDRAKDRESRRLVRSYFGPERYVFEGLTEFSRTFGAWVRLFRENGLSIERLEEPRPPAGHKSRYLSRADDGWARRWPLECLWVLERQPNDGARRARRSARTSSPSRR